MPRKTLDRFRQRVGINLKIYSGVRRNAATLQRVSSGFNDLLYERIANSRGRPPPLRDFIVMSFGAFYNFKFRKRKVFVFCFEADYPALAG